MTPEDKPRFAATLTGLAAIKPGKGLTPEAMDVWWAAMKHWPIEAFVSAAAHLSRSVEFMPSPYHFEQLLKAGRPTPGEAWAEILQMAKHSYTAVPEDPVMARALSAIGGLRAVAMHDSDKLHFLEKRFVEHYVDLEDATDTRIAVPEVTDAGRRLGGPASIGKLLERFTDRVDA